MAYNPGMIPRRAFLALGAAAVASSRVARAAAIPTLPLGFHLASADDAPVVGAEWLATELAECNRLLAPHEISVGEAWRRPLAAGPAIDTAADRDALAKHLVDGAINVFVVGSLRDIDAPSGMRMGVRWRLRKNLQKSYIILSADARTTTLCHELGHELGLPHSTVTDNVMSYKREHPELLAFDALQARIMRQTARLLWAKKRLSAL